MPLQEEVSRKNDDSELTSDVTRRPEGLKDG